jgi:hypothetical protein
MEEYVPAGEIVASNLERDLNLFTEKYKNIDASYLKSFRDFLAEVNGMESVFAATEGQKKLTVELYAECDDFLDKLLYMKSYAKEAELNFGIISIIMKQLRHRNVEGAMRNMRDAIEYYNDNASRLSISNMPEGFVDELIADVNRIEGLNNTHNTYLVNKKERTAQNNAVYLRLYHYISEICAAGKLIFKKDTVKRKVYTIERIAMVLQSTRKKPECSKTPQL